MKERTFKYGHFCRNCRKQLELDDQVYFVEEQGGNYFCSEQCIQDFYNPVAQYYYKEHRRLRDPHDIPPDNFSDYEQYAPLCVEKPEEIWVDENDAGEQFYYFIKEFSDAGGKFFYVIMSFCLELEPTFVLISFPTRDRKLLEVYRRGKQVDTQEREEWQPPVAQDLESYFDRNGGDQRGQAIRAEMLRSRQGHDIDESDFEEHSYLLEETIENPDEAWELSCDKDGSILTLISQHDESLHYVVICSFDGAANMEDGNWRVLYHFPTDDPSLVNRYRRGIPKEGITQVSVFH